MPSPNNTHPNVFIIESLYRENEEERMREGKLLSEMLHLAGKECRYIYIRTRSELDWALNLFDESKFRYLHISCHANATAMDTTLDEIPFSELGPLLRPHLAGKRLFLSACSMASDDLAQAILLRSGYRSILGPSTPVDFHDAAIFWAAFYHRMFALQQNNMSTFNLLKTAQILASVFGIKLNCYYPFKGRRLLRKIAPKSLNWT
jgi:hypothetical protein